ncbi:MAG: hypothetical protein AABY64_03090 [Bdellovibrionota bacterium]
MRISKNLVMMLGTFYISMSMASNADFSRVYSTLSEIQNQLNVNRDKYQQRDLDNISNSLQNVLALTQNHSGGSSSDIIKACVQGFGNGSSGTECAQKAFDADAVRACLAGFGNGSSGLSCAISSRYASIVNACVQGFGNGSSGMECAQNAYRGDVVRACVAGFGNGTSGRECSVKARDAEVVKTCVASFGNGSSGLKCATGN